MVTSQVDLPVSRVSAPIIPTTKMASSGSYVGHGDPDIPAHIGATYLDLDTGYTWRKTSGDGEIAGWVIAGLAPLAFFGAANDGVTDDTEAIVDAAAALQSGQTIEFSNNLMRVATAGGVAVTFDNLSDITLRGKIVNDEFGEDSAVWKSITSLTTVGSTVTAVTAQAHGKTVGTVVLVMNDGPRDYNGAVTITEVPTTTSFKYVTVDASTPSGAGSGGRWAAVDYLRTLFKFTRCKNVKIDLEFVGQYRDRSVGFRLGYVICDFQSSGGVDNEMFDIRLKCYGAAATLSAGSYQSATTGHIKELRVRHLKAVNVGYPIQFWGAAGSNSTYFITAEDVHRGAYFAGLSNAEIWMGVKNFDQSGLLLTSHAASGGEHIGCENIFGQVTDLGTTEDASFVESAHTRYLYGLYVNSDAGSPKFRSITMRTILKQTQTLGRNITPIFIDHQGNTAAVFDGIYITGNLDRSAITDISGMVGNNYEMFFRLPALTEVRNVVIRDWRVKNSTVTDTPEADFKRDINIENNVGLFYYFNATSDSLEAVTITGGTVRDFDDSNLPDGSASAPALAWDNSGFYHTSDIVRLTLGGVLAFSFSTNSFFPSVNKAADLGSGPQMFRTTYTEKVVIDNGPTISSGTGVPAAAEPNGSIFFRTDGTGPNLYVRENGAWVAK